VIVVEWESPPLVAVTVTVYVPVGVDLVVETVSVIVAEPPCESNLLFALRETVGPPLTTGDIVIPPRLKAA